MGYDEHGGKSGGLPTDAILDALSNRRRRLLLSLLRATNRPLALADAAREIAYRDSEKPFEAVTSEELEDVYISLHHVHVPKLATLGVVTYDTDRKTIALADSFDRDGGVAIEVEHV